jgi:tripartite-type tricarboxylate transporter receptor subunit TctC
MRVVKEGVMRLRPLVAMAFGLCALSSAQGAKADAIADFYKGKTVSVYIGFSAGGTYDLFGRLVARHLGKHLPGAPTVIAQSMPGAGSFTLANWMYKIAPKDGTAIGIISQTAAIEEVLKSPGIQFKSAEFNWIGRATSNVEITLVWHTSKANTVMDALNNDIPLASTGAGSPSEGYPKLINGVLGTRFKLVGPYPGSTDGLLAMERGETDGALTSWNTLNTARHDWIVDKKIRVLVQYALQRTSDMPDVPTMVELGKTPEDKAMFAFYVSGGEVGRSFIAPPGVPSERVEALRRAFDATMKDPELLAEVTQAKLDFHPGTGEQVQKIITDTASIKPEIIERMQNLLQK